MVLFSVATFGSFNLRNLVVCVSWCLLYSSISVSSVDSRFLKRGIQEEELFPLDTIVLCQEVEQLVCETAVFRSAARNMKMAKGVSSLAVLIRITGCRISLHPCCYPTACFH